MGGHLDDLLSQLLTPSLVPQGRGSWEALL